MKRRSHWLRAAPGALLGLLLSVLPAEATEPAASDPPALPGARFPALATENATTLRRGHDLLLTWLEPGTEGLRLRFARLSTEGWSPPVTIAEPVASPEPGDPPSLTVLDTQAVRRTLLARTGAVIARSGNAGRTWARLPFAEPLSWSSFAGGDEGGYVFWLRPQEGENAARLLGTRILAGESLLDHSVARDQGTAAAMTWDGPIVVYRDAPTGNLAVVRREAARWLAPQPVHGGDGAAAGKPGSAPRVAALRRQVAVAWIDPPLEGGSSGPRLRLAFSADAARTFPVAVEIPGGAEAVDVALDETGDALLLWRRREIPDAELHLARVAIDGRRGESLLLARGPADSLTGGPRVVRVGDRVAATWTEGDPARLRLLVVPTDSLPAAAPPPAPPPVPAPVYHGRGRVGEAAPELEVMTLEGQPISLPALRGQAVVLNLWATWCLPCIAEMPQLAALHERYRAAGLTVVGVSLDDADALAKVRQFATDLRLPFPIWVDPEAQFQGALNVRGLPATFVIDRQGRIVLRRDGVLEGDDPALTRAIDRALGGT